MKQKMLHLCALFSAVALTFSGCATPVLASQLVESKPVEVEEVLIPEQIFMPKGCKYFIAYRGTNKFFYLSFSEKKPIEVGKVNIVYEKNLNFQFFTKEKLLEYVRGEARELKGEEGTRIQINYKNGEILATNFSMESAEGELLWEPHAYVEPKQGVEHLYAKLTSKEIFEQTSREIFGLVPLLMVLLVSFIGLRKGINFVKKLLEEA